jgi:hypothetical protein
VDYDCRVQPERSPSVVQNMELEYKVADAVMSAVSIPVEVGPGLGENNSWFIYETYSYLLLRLSALWARKSHAPNCFGDG